MKRIIGAVALWTLAVLVALGAAFLSWVTVELSKPRPVDSVSVAYPVAADGTVELPRGGMEVGIRPDTSHPDYQAGTKLPKPECSVTAPDGAAQPLDEVVRSPRWDEFTVLVRFFAYREGTYRVSCTDVSPVPAEVVVRTDVWEENRMMERERRIGLSVILIPSGLIVLGLAAVGWWLVLPELRDRRK
ncbi:hypothetical protein [Enemella sp. A6]|uniref:hypothetical protein n=1 Tax=Enemella sp. A6 TaxID=3440152 RepID=UPI003EBD59F5